MIVSLQTLKINKIKVCRLAYKFESETFHEISYKVDVIY